jgi:ribosomal protein L40E
MRLKAQSYDQAYWVTKDEVAKSSPSTQSANTKDKDKPSYSDKKRYTPSDQQSTSRSGFRPNNTSSSTNSFSKFSSPSSGSTRKPDLSEKLGKDGKLRSDERKRRMEKNLCLYCGAGGHSAKDCRKSTSTRGRAAQASSSSASAQPATESSDSKK